LEQDPESYEDEDTGVSSGSDSEEPEDETTTEDAELTRLKGLLPSLSRKENVTQLDVILEAIRYIDSLRGRLLTILPHAEEL